MRHGILKPKNWIKVAFCISLAGLTNHSLGDIVYKKLVIVEPTPPHNAPDRYERRYPQRRRDDALVISRIDKQTDQLLTILSSSEGLQSGSILEAQRPSRLDERAEPLWVTTGLLKVEDIRPGYAIARVLEDSSFDSSLHFKEAPGVMVGDRIVPQTTRITQNIKILPTLTLLYKDLFLDPKGFPLTFELSSEGLENLKEQAKIFLGAHSPSLLIEAYTDTEGDRQSNQMESYQRALTIRQTLIDELGFDPDRLIAVGLGESEPLEEMNLPGKKALARRIVLKVNQNEVRIP